MLRFWGDASASARTSGCTPFACFSTVTGVVAETVVPAADESDDEESQSENE